jgi:histidine triad (HIT) family protein
MSRSNYVDSCIFCKISAGQIPCQKVYEDADFLAFYDINPAAPVHVLLVPKAHVAHLQDMVAHPELSLLTGSMMSLAVQIAKQLGCDIQGDGMGEQGGFRITMNSGPDGGQEVGHVHLHLMGGRRPW